MSAPARRRCCDCSHTFEEPRPPAGRWVNPTVCPECGCDDTDVIGMLDLLDTEALVGYPIPRVFPRAA